MQRFGLVLLRPQLPGYLDGNAGDVDPVATIWQLVQDPAHGTDIPASAITRVIGIITQPDGGPPVVGHVVGDLAPRTPLGMAPYPTGS